jgi:hypothetical protein
MYTNVSISGKFFNQYTLKQQKQIVKLAETMEPVHDLDIVHPLPCGGFRLTDGQNKYDLDGEVFGDFVVLNIEETDWNNLQYWLDSWRDETEVRGLINLLATCERIAMQLQTVDCQPTPPEVKTANQRGPEMYSHVPFPTPEQMN